MKETLQSIVSALVSNPENVAVDETNENDLFTYTVHVSKDDMGKIIGREGKVIRALRNVMKIKAMKQNIRINIALAENE
jgi:predicted RNA-binding protein YlqC (UPF0109 family)